nr:ATP-binding protein [Tropicibacter naphthalenivorans]
MRHKRAPWIVLFLALVAGLGWSVWRYGYAQALEQVSARGQSDLALASDRLVTGLMRYRSVAVLLADHPALEALHRGGGRAEAERLLLASADRTGALTAFYADARGEVLASALPEVPEALPEQPWFRRALDGALGVSHGVSERFEKRAFFYATPSFDADGQVQGVLVIMVDVDTLERDWRGSRPAVLFRDEGGEVFVTNRSELLFWRQEDDGLTGPGGEVIALRRADVAGHEIWHQRISQYVPQTALHLEQPLPVIGMRGEALVDAAPAQRVAGLQAAIVMALCLFFGSLLFLATERRRALAQANVTLEARVKARTRDLESANVALRREVSEREEAEAALRRAQADLVQAGKLSALGQMSAGISHELNQPLMAIGQYAENGAAFLQRGKPEKAAENLGRIASLATRAARIIKNLRAFARNESEPMGKVDLTHVIDTAVELTEARLRGDGVALQWDRPEGSVYAVGGEVRLGQVFVNLINNAADAMAGQARRAITIALEEGARLRVTVRDTGPGIADPERVFEPFYSTKEVGDGMGLGLSISYGLVQSFGGDIRGVNAPEGGACFTVELDPWRQEAAA